MREVTVFLRRIPEPCEKSRVESHNCQLPAPGLRGFSAYKAACCRSGVGHFAPSFRSTHAFRSNLIRFGRTKALIEAKKVGRLNYEQPKLSVCTAKRLFTTVESGGLRRREATA